jgi:hypothetical protein
MGWLRDLLTPGRLTREDAIRIAQQECAARGVAFLEPVRTYRRLHGWLVCTHAGHFGGTAFVTVDSRTGRVRGFQFVSR